MPSRHFAIVGAAESQKEVETFSRERGPSACYDECPGAVLEDNIFNEEPDCFSEGVPGYIAFVSA